MGGGILALLLGVVALVLLMPSKPREVPPYERTLLWVYDSANPSGSGVGAILEEAHQEQRLSILAFPAPPEALAVFKSKDNAKKAQQQVATLAGRKVHHRLFLPYSVIEVLIKATGGIEVEGRHMDGPTAVRFITEDETKAPDRAQKVMLAVADAAMNKQFSLSTGEALRLAGQVETDMDLMGLGDVFGRWNSYGEPKAVQLQKLTPEAANPWLQPDPAEEPQK